MSKILDRLEAASLADPLVFGITHVPLDSGRPWKMTHRAWLPAIYNAGNPFLIEKDPLGYRKDVVIIKATQMGITTMAIIRALHFLMGWDVRVWFGLPRERDVNDFVGTRLDPMIKASPLLSSRISQPNNNSTKAFKPASFLYIVPMLSEPRSIPVDMVVADEVDLTPQVNVDVARNRMDASPWKISIMLSTPTFPDYGIDRYYKESDMREWLVKCPECGHEQELDWEINLMIEGNPDRPRKVWYGCEKCGAELDLDTINNNGRWVAKRPDAFSIGFHLHQMLNTPAPELYRIYNSPSTNIEEFWRKRLGKPHAVEGGQLSVEDLKGLLFTRKVEKKNFPESGKMYFAGADQGNTINMVVVEYDPLKPENLDIVLAEAIPLSVGFKRLDAVMGQFNIRMMVVDGNPNRHNALALTENTKAG